MTRHTPRYGRMLSDFEVGAIYEHPWEVTVDGGHVALWQASFLDAAPLPASSALAQKLGFRDRPLPPMLLLNLGLSFSVHDVSEQAIAHLAYLDVRFPNPAYPADTVHARSEVLGVKPTSTGDRGVVHVRTTLLTTTGTIVCDFERMALIRAGTLGDRPVVASRPPDALPSRSALVRIPPPLRERPAPAQLRVALPGLADELTPGEVIVHSTAKTVGESEHMQLTYLVRNTHPLHYDEQYCKAGHSFAGTRVVYGGLVLAWVASLASRDVAGNTIWEVGLDDGAHPNGVVAGDTLYAASRVESVTPLDDDWAEVSFRLVGTKNTRPDSLALDALFAPELKKEKADKISAKVVEITRTLLMRRRVD